MTAELPNETQQEQSNRRHNDTRIKVSLIPKFLELLFYVSVAISFGIGIVWWNEDPPMTVVERFLLTKDIEQGDLVKILNIVVHSKVCDVTVYRSIVDSDGVVHTIAPQNRWPKDKIGKFEYTSETIIPRAAAPGPAIYRVKATWHCNPLQELFTPEIELNDVEITIIKRDLP